MVLFDAVHALAHELSAEGLRVNTLHESYLSLEGLARAIDANPPRFGQTSQQFDSFMNVFQSRGALPVIMSAAHGKWRLTLALCAHNLEVEGHPLRDVNNISISLDDAFGLFELDWRKNDDNIDYVILPGDQYLELVNNSVALDSKKRQLFLKGINEDSTAVESFLAVIKYAINHGVSDIHIEPDSNLSATNINAVRTADHDGEMDVLGGRVRYRQDGVLVSGNYFLTPDNIKRLVAVVKSSASLKMDEHRLPQDGRITFGDDDIAKHPKLADYDLRVSIMPTVHGEKAQLRLLKKKDNSFALKDCGFAPDIQGHLGRLINSPKGLILVTGPTGSGKTTTLYALLNEINDGTRNIVTLEDPVEIVKGGMVQSQIDPKIGYDFASGLRVMMRQDPDVIFVGEIRDGETANAATRAAITGHLVFSTLHVDSAPDTIMRLEGLGVPGLYVSSSLLAVISQRLVRKICPACREQYEAGDEIQTLLGQGAVDVNGVKTRTFLFNGDLKLWRSVRGNHCNLCNGTGYAGRQLLAEFYVPRPVEKEKIASGVVSGNEFHNLALQNGFEPLSHVAMRAVINGDTDIKEVLRSAITADEFLRDGRLIATSLNKYLAKQTKA